MSKKKSRLGLKASDGCGWGAIWKFGVKLDPVREKEKRFREMFGDTDVRGTRQADKERRDRDAQQGLDFNLVRTLLKFDPTMTLNEAKVRVSNLQYEQRRTTK